MAKVWFVYEGPEPTRGSPAYELPAEEAIERLGVTQERFLSGLDAPGPRFNKDSSLGQIAGRKHVVLELEENEAKATGWVGGYYYVSGDPEEVIALLGPPTSE
jgi:hypothetical protein